MFHLFVKYLTELYLVVVVGGGGGGKAYCPAI